MQGNLKDFSITNILPIIKAETKTGVLEVKGERNNILVTFLNGAVVYAQYGDTSWFARVRDTLIAAQLISPDAWKPLEQYAETPEHLWESLANVVPPESASAVLRRQVTDTLFDLLRYKKGAYSFNPMKSVEYPEKLMHPMDVDFLLMEGCRIADEFGILEKKMPKPERFLRRSIMTEEEIRLNRPDKSVKEPLDFRETLDFAVLSGRGVEVNDHEVKVLSVMNRPRTTKQIMNMADLSYLDSSNAILSLLNKKVVAEMSPRELAALEKPEGRSATGGYVAIALGLLLAAFGIFHRATFWHPLQLENWKGFTGVVAQAQVRRELEELYRNIRIYHQQTGQMPASLMELTRSGVMSARLLKDPWKRDYVYKLDAESFQLYSVGRDGFPATEDDLAIADQLHLPDMPAPAPVADPEAVPADAAAVPPAAPEAPAAVPAQ